MKLSEGEWADLLQISSVLRDEVEILIVEGRLDPNGVLAILVDILMSHLKAIQSING